MRLTGDAKTFHDWMKSNKHGELMGVRKGGHLEYRLHTGALFITAATPSDHMYLMAAKADVRRLLGLASDSPRSGKHKSFRPPKDAYNGDTRKREAWAVPAERDEHAAELKDVDAKLATINPRREPGRARALARRRLELAELLARYGAVAPRVAIQ